MDRETRDMLLDTAGRFFTARSGKDVVNGVEKGVWPAEFWQEIEEMGIAAFNQAAREHGFELLAKVRERGEDLGADDDVLLDVLELFGCERTLLVQDRFARPDLPDVVQSTCDAHMFDFLLRDAELVGYGG